MADRDLLLVELDELGADPERYLETARRLGSTLVVTLDGKPQITVDDPETLAVVEAEVAARQRIDDAAVTTIGASHRGDEAGRFDLSA
ncbi:MAG: hypothetical protein ACQETV_07390 [Actinomycetota bacterium]